MPALKGIYDLLIVFPECAFHRINTAYFVQVIFANYPGSGLG